MPSRRFCLQKHIIYDTGRGVFPRGLYTTWSSSPGDESNRSEPCAARVHPRQDIIPLGSPSLNQGSRLSFSDRHTVGSKKLISVLREGVPPTHREFVG